MIKRYFGLFVVFLLLIAVYGCREQINNSNPTPTTDQKTDSAASASKLDDLQTTACNTADDAGTCDTKLKDIGIVTKEDCCKFLKKCC